MKSSVLAGPGLLMLATVATAQTPSRTSASAAETPRIAVEEIVVTARRRAESLQDIPQTVDAVTSEAIEKLNLLKFEDVQAVVPGLNLQSGNSGYSTTASMRGAGFTVETSAPPTVEFYLNDAPVESMFMFQSLYDIGQIEVLRGPQGTLRGRASPSGAITVTTHAVDVSEFGGYASVTGGNRDSSNVQGAINVPLISEKLALRVAGLYDENEGNGVKSLATDRDPYVRSKAGRASLRFEPTDSVSTSLTYSHSDKQAISWDPVYGPGHTTGTIPNAISPALGTYTTPPTNYNGPALEATDRRGITENPRTLDQVLDAAIANVDWRISGQKLSYVAGWSEVQLDPQDSADHANLIPGYDAYQIVHSRRRGWTHEIRLASEERVAELFDYTVGAFYSTAKTSNTVNQVGSYQPGAFGNPFLNPVPGAPNPRYTLPLFIDQTEELEETSAFASVTFHLGERLELTGGGRYIVIEGDKSSLLFVGPAFTNAPLPPVPGFTPAQVCAGNGGTFGGGFPGLCEIPIPRLLQQDLQISEKKKPFIYNASASYRFSDDFMMYANTGTSWRRGPTSIGLISSTVQTDPTLRALVFHEPEKSKSYEVGFKSSFMEQRGRLNLALYHQTFDDFFFYTDYLPFVSVQNGRASKGTYRFTANTDAVVDGADLDAAFQINQRWSVGLSASYADGHVDDDFVPCNDSNLDGVADSGVLSDAAFIATMQAAGLSVAQCRTDQSITAFPKWNATVQSEFSLPVTQSFDGYVRGLLTYYPSDDRTEDGGIDVDSYGLLNVYLGVRDPDGAWEVTLFAKNATDTDEQLSGGGAAVSSLGGLGSYFGNSGYFDTRITPRREFGLSVRYAFGSR